MPPVKRFFAWLEARSRVRPGLTGLWQVRGRWQLDVWRHD